MFFRNLGSQVNPNIEYLVQLNSCDFVKNSLKIALRYGEYMDYKNITEDRTSPNFRFNREKHNQLCNLFGKLLIEEPL